MKKDIYFILLLFSYSFVVKDVLYNFNDYKSISDYIKHDKKYIIPMLFMGLFTILYEKCRKDDASIIIGLLLLSIYILILIDNTYILHIISAFFSFFTIFLYFTYYESNIYLKNSYYLSLIILLYNYIYNKKIYNYECLSALIFAISYIKRYLI